MCKVTMNEVKKGIELAFGSRPSAEVLAEVKANGFHWNNKTKVWYAKQTESSLAFAESIGKLEKKHPAPKSEPKKEAPKSKESILDSISINAPLKVPTPEPIKAESLASYKAMLEMFYSGNYADLGKALLDHVVAENQTPIVESEKVAEKPKKAKAEKKPEKVSRSDNAIINRVVKGTKSETMKFAQKLKDGFGFTNGMMAIFSDSAMGREVAKESIDLSKSIPSEADNTYQFEVDMDSLNTLIKAKEQRYVITLDEKGNKVAFNPKFMKDCLTWCETDKVSLNPDMMKGGCYKAPMLINGSRKAICCPISVQ